jgi:hypothetical protein
MRIEQGARIIVENWLHAQPEDVVHFATYQATDKVWGQIGGHYFCYQGE